MGFDIVEHLFDYGGMTVAEVVPREVVLARLRAQVSALEWRPQTPAYAVPPPLEPLLDGGLKPGAAYTLERSAAGALLLALLARPSQDGLWCGLVGLPDIGAEAAHLAGVNLERVAFVPHPGAKWLAVVAALAAVLPVVAVQPPEPVRAPDATRISARLREHESVLLSVGTWPGAEAAIGVTGTGWQGLGEGWGRLTARTATVQVLSKRSPRPRQAHVLLPGPDGGLAPAPVLQPAPVRLRVAA